MTPDLSYELEGERERKMCEDNEWNEKKINKKCSCRRVCFSRNSKPFSFPNDILHSRLVSVPTILILQVERFRTPWSQNYAAVILLIFLSLGRQCNAMLSYWIRQARHRKLLQAVNKKVAIQMRSPRWFKNSTCV